MRIVFAYNDQIETVEDVSVDDKCFPLVAGIHPYSVSSPETSPLYREAALWFKTLAIDSIFIDCNRRLIFWTPVQNDVNPEIVSFRKSASTDSTSKDFLPASAKPLFEDSSHYEFDASLKEMMVMCLNNVRDYLKKRISKDKFNTTIAHILHVYILKSVVFDYDHMYCLNRAKGLIEERLRKADETILEVADNIDKLNKCLNALLNSVLKQENLESEQYLRTCNREFLQVFLNKLEENLQRKNFHLEAEQSKVNWAKASGDEACKIEELQENRNKLFEDIEKLIKVREAIKNVSTRKDKSKSKIKHQNAVSNCFHNIFIEIDRRINVENAVLNRLCNDKVNISAAREATVAIIIELNTNRDSLRETKFLPDDCVDYLPGGQNIDKPIMWLTFQERVCRAFEQTSSEPFEIHKRGCAALRDQINLALSEYSLTVNPNIHSDCIDSHIPGHQTPEVETVDKSSYINIQQCKSRTPQSGNDNELMGNIPILLVNPILNFQLEQQEPHAIMPIKTKEDKMTDRCSVYCPSESDDVPVQLALKALMKQIDNIKSSMQSVFFDVVDTLSKHLCQETISSLPEQAELLWKSYERTFCQEILHDLNKLYYTGLQIGIHSAYKALTKEPLHEILKGDKILDLFFNSMPESKITGTGIPLSDKALDTISLATTVSVLSLDIRHCDINDLYKIANNDSYNLSQQIGQDLPSDIDDAVGDSASSESSADTESLTQSVSSNVKPSSDIQEDIDSLNQDDSDTMADLAKDWDSLYNPGRVAEILDPVLTPFRRYIKKCLDANCFLDKVRYIAKAIEDLNRDISRLYGPNHQSACDDIITMLVLALSNMSEDVFVGLYIDLRLLMDILPSFLSGTLYDYNLVSLFAAYDFLFSRNVCNSVIRKYPGSFKRKSQRRNF